MPRYNQSEFELALPLPWSGKSQSMAHSAQTPDTTRAVQNMRPIDPTDGRRKLAQRSGFDDYVAAGSTGSGKVQALCSFMQAVSNVTYTNLVTAETISYT